MKTHAHALKKITLAFLASSPSWLFATPTIPDSGLPGAAVPALPEKFATTLPQTLSPLTFSTPQTNQATQASALHFTINKITLTGFDKNSRLEQSEVEGLANQLLSQSLDKNHQITLENLNQIADQLSKFIIQKGFFLARVYIPPQNISEERVVRFEVREGVLEKINLHGKTIYTDAQLREPFKNYIGKPITAQELESALLTLRGYPGLEVNSILSPGTVPGSTIVTIDVTGTDRFNLELSADNYGSDTTGKNRGTITGHIYNLTHGADDLALSYLKKFDPRASEYYEADYTRNFFFPQTQINGGYSYNWYNLAGTVDGLGLTGMSQMYHVALIQNFLLRRNFQFSGELSLNHDMGYLKQNGTVLNQDKITFASASLSSQFNVDKFRFIDVNELTYQHGFNHFLDSMGSTAPYEGHYPARRGGSLNYAQGNFNLESLNIHLYQQPFRYQLIEVNLYGQYSPDLLTSFSQMSAGGEGSLPGYTTSEYLFDKGFKSHLSWKFPIPGFTDRRFLKSSYRMGDVFHLGLFTDYASGWVNDPNATQVRHVALSDYGIGAYISLGSYLQIEAIAARPYPSATQPQDGERTRYWVGLNYVYTRF